MRGFHILIKGVSFSSTTDVGSHNPPRPSASRYCPLWALSFELPLKVLKTHLLGRGFHTLIKGVPFSSPTMWNLTIHPLQGSTSSLALVPFSNRCGTPTKSTSLQGPTSLLAPPCVYPPSGNRLLAHIVQCLALVPFVSAQAHH